jgi:hypothetical protein
MPHLSISACSSQVLDAKVRRPCHQVIPFSRVESRKPGMAVAIEDFKAPPLPTQFLCSAANHSVCRIACISVVLPVAVLTSSTIMKNGYPCCLSGNGPAAGWCRRSVQLGTRGLSPSGLPVSGRPSPRAVPGLLIHGELRAVLSTLLHKNPSLMLQHSTTHTQLQHMEPYWIRHGPSVEELKHQGRILMQQGYDRPL